MLALRDGDMTKRNDRAGVSLGELTVYLVPLTTIAALALLTTEPIFTTHTVVQTLAFFFAQLSFLLFRSALGQMRMAAWDLAPPLLLVFIVWNDFNLAVTVLASIASIGWLLSRRSTSGARPADSLIIQLPSLCLAPVALIFLRDLFQTRLGMERADLETIGMIINGLGAAGWTATVMRTPTLLPRISNVLWLVGSLGAAFLTLANRSFIVAVGALLIAELLRGSLWLATTHMLRYSSRWIGFTINLFGTLLPLAALIVVKPLIASTTLIAVYSAFYVAVPIALYLFSRAMGSRINGHAA